MYLHGNWQRVLLPHDDSRTPAEGPYLWPHPLEHEQEERECFMRVLFHLPGCDPHHSAHISLARTSHMVLANCRGLGHVGNRGNVVEYSVSSILLCCPHWKWGKICIVFRTESVVRLGHRNELTQDVMVTLATATKRVWN